MTVRLGTKLRHTHIREGSDVFLECDVKANPPLIEMGWRFEGRELTPTSSSDNGHKGHNGHNGHKGVVISEHSLVLQKVTRCDGVQTLQSESKFVSTVIFYAILLKYERIVWGFGEFTLIHNSYYFQSADIAEENTPAQVPTLWVREKVPPYNFVLNVSTYERLHFAAHFGVPKINLKWAVEAKDVQVPCIRNRKQQPTQARQFVHNNIIIHIIVC